VLVPEYRKPRPTPNDVDNGYRGHDTSNPRRVFISGQKRGVFPMHWKSLRRFGGAHALNLP
jgi:hypothetical protein